jgi:hypothetical protein
VRKHGKEWRQATAASCHAEVVTKAEARRVKPGGFGAVPLGFATDAPRGSAGSFTFLYELFDPAIGGTSPGWVPQKLHDGRSKEFFKGLWVRSGEFSLATAYLRRERKKPEARRMDLYSLSNSP